MLSLTSIRSKEYYIDLSSEDYYLDGGEPPGKWHGQGADALALQGQIHPGHFHQVIDGFMPDGSGKLVQNAGAPKRQPGWDLTFSAPKTVSVVWSQAEKETRHSIQEAQEKAVRKALDWLESESVTRRGKGGHIKEPARLIVATFEHGTSRAQDPQLHTHCLIMNAAVRQDGTTGAIESQQFYRNKMTAGALYRAELAKQLEERLGLQVIKKGNQRNLFELRGVDPALAEEFSKRREEIQAALDASGNSSAKAAEIATLDTRHVKGHMAREELFAEWQSVGAAFGYQPPQPKFIARDAEVVAGALRDAALEALMYCNSTFVEKDWLRKMAEEAPGTGTGALEIQQAVRAGLQLDQIVCLGRVGEDIRYTTKEMLALETKMLTTVKASTEQKSHPVSDRSLTSVLADFPTLKPEQTAAVKHLIAEYGTIKVVEGWAGTGKTFMLNVARKAWENAGYRVHGAALAAKAADGLEEGSGIRSQTLHSLLYKLRDGRLKLNRKDVVVVDEAGMIGTRQFAELITTTKQAGAKLILVGDAKQLQPIEAGGAFQKIGDLVGRAELMEITRQQIHWMRQAVKDMIAGNTRDVLTEYARHGQLSVQEDWNNARSALVANWSRNGGLKLPQDNIILAASNLDVFDLNEQAQAARQAAGLVGGNQLKVNCYRIMENDRVQFTRNDSYMGVKNGQNGTVMAVTGRFLKVQLDNGERKDIDTASYEHLKLGYAMTTHKAQGDTRQQNFVLVGGSMQDRELSYVQLSRTRDKTFLFTDRLEAGDELARLARGMARSRQKELAATFLPCRQQAAQQDNKLQR